MDRAHQLHELAMFAHDEALFYEADWVFIEDIIVGNNRKYSIRLAQTMGAVLADLALLEYRQGLSIRTVDNKAWKKEIVGNGNADKEAVRNYILESHPAYAPLCGDDQDRFDAVCIGLYGRRILDRSQQLSAGGLVGSDRSAHP
jgi:Holliday junction resolvasome RuvABC endonuclease subunit